MRESEVDERERERVGREKGCAREGVRECG